MEYQGILIVSIGGRENGIWNRMDVEDSSSIGSCFRQKMMKLAILMFCVAAATAGLIPTPIESAPSNVEADMEASATHHHGVYERNIGIYAGALPSVYPSYPTPYYPSYSPAYVPAGYGYPYRPYPSYGVGWNTNTWDISGNMQLARNTNVENKICPLIAYPCQRYLRFKQIDKFYGLTR
ncbi:hypothetical protein GHT06_020771 [Daphnia sinensis]|uniref:Uncharacterized protein n=1 Tax=Daphnia sinensis TaxID=1820382 RepID=A0AAD5PN65_9CRUS|nr:hypothetical protein GHT06_020771 [Daphnia sinensis]